MGYSTFNSDLVVRKLLSDKNFLFRKGLGDGPFQERILKEEGLLLQLEEALYPEIAKERDKWLTKELPNKKPLFIEIPLLFEKYSQVPPISLPFSIISVITGIKLQRARVLKRGIKVELLNYLLARQVSDEIRLAKSDYIIYTCQSKQKVKQAIKKILHVTAN